MIGRNVLVPKTSLALENNAAVVGIDLSQAVDQLPATILNSVGIAVRRLDLGAQSKGVNTFVWDGMTDSGATATSSKYSFSVSAKQSDQDIAADTLTLGSVNSMAPGKKGLFWIWGNWDSSF